MNQRTLHILFFVIAASFLSGTVSADDVEQCARLFKEHAEISTCRTIQKLNAGKVADDYLQEKVSQSIYGMSAEKAEKERPRREEATRKARAEKATETSAEEPQCYRLFVEQTERKECRLLRALTSTERTDDEMRDAVRARLGSIRIDEEHTRAATQALKKREEDAKAAEELRKNAVKIDERRRSEEAKRAATNLDTQLKQGDLGFALKGWEMGGFGVVMSISFTLQNNTSNALADFLIVCKTRANSDTILSSPRQMLYERLEPGKRRKYELNMGVVHPQSARATCSVVKWATR